MTNLTEILKYFIKQWKIIAAIIGSSVILFAGIVGLFCGLTENSSQKEEYVYKKQAEMIEEYMDKSILMKLDSSGFYKIIVRVDYFPKKEELKSFVLEESLWADMERELSENYYAELTSFNELEYDASEIVFRHVDEQECLKCANHIKNKLSALYSWIEISVSEVIRVNGQEAMDEQLANEKITKSLDSVIYSLKNSSMFATEDYSEKLFFVSAVAYGFAVGTLLSVFVVSLMFCRKKEANCE